MTSETEGWRDVSTLPDREHRPGRMFVVVEGSEFHSGEEWFRASYGIARTSGDGFNRDDIAAIEAADSMAAGTGRVTHWMPLNLPPCPQFARGAA